MNKTTTNTPNLKKASKVKIEEKYMPIPAIKVIRDKPNNDTWRNEPAGFVWCSQIDEMF